MNKSIHRSSDIYIAIGSELGKMDFLVPRRFWRLVEVTKLFFCLAESRVQGAMVRYEKHSDDKPLVAVRARFIGVDSER